MLKALLKKQLMEVNVWLLQNKKTGERRSPRGILGQLLLYIVLFAMLGSLFYFVGTALLPVLHVVELDWLYFAMMGLMALMLGLFGSMFNTASALYLAKDNALLLSLPIPPRYVLFSRLVSIGMWSLIYSGLVYVPALLAYWIQCGFTAACLLSGLLSLLFLSILVLALSCLLGWVVAKISVRLKGKSFVRVLASLVFLAVYYFICFQANTILQSILLHLDQIQQNAAKVLPLFWLGKGTLGELSSLLLFCGSVILFFGLILWGMSHNFLKLATNAGSVSARRTARTAVKVASLDAALLRKELRRFTASSSYMLNCALGTIFLPAIGILVLVKAEALLGTLSLIGLSQGQVMLLLCAAAAAATSINDISAPSVSLEGRNLWLLQSLPVPAWQVLRAKLRLHWLLTLPPALFCSGCLCIAINVDLISALLLFLVPTSYVLLSGTFGLVANLKAPNLTWTSEIVPLKQGGSVALSLFGGWLFVLLLGGSYFLLRNILAPTVFLLLCALFFLLLTAGLLHWLKTRGTKIFEAL